VVTPTLGCVPIVVHVGSPSRLHWSLACERVRTTQAHLSPQPGGTPILPTILIALKGHLTLSELERALEPTAMQLRSAATNANLLFDCLAMTGYDKAARERFVEWHRASRGHLGRVGIVTSNSLWYVVVSAMSLAAGHPMKAFNSVIAAESWLNEPHEKSR